MATQNLGNVRALIVSATAPTNTDLLWRNTSTSPQSINIFNSTNSTWEPIAMSSGGQDNTASNVGSGEGIFVSKVGVDLRFRSLIAGTNITLASDGTSVTISSTDTGEANTASNLGAGTGLFTTKAGVNLPFRSLVGGTNVNLTNDTNTVTINATDTGEVNTASNLGVGTGLFTAKTGDNLPFRSLVGGTATTLSSDANTVTIDVDDTTKIPLTQRGAANGVATLGADSLVPAAQLPITAGARAISSQALADAATYTVDMSTSAVVQLNVAAAATTATLAVSNIMAAMEMRNKVIIDNTAVGAVGLTVTFNDQSSAITFRRALNEFPGTYPAMNVTANTTWEVEFENESATVILLDFIQVEG